ncbi:hypothetical protein [Streptomyces viridochromogenes]|nr:hypothetical protein [Streptomyces viridochromogenes]
MEVVIESVVTEVWVLCLSLPSFCVGWTSRGSSAVCVHRIRGQT